MTIEELVEVLNKIPNITVEVDFWNTIYVCSPYGTFSYSDSCNLIIWQEREKMLFRDRTPEQILSVVKALVEQKDGV